MRVLAAPLIQRKEKEREKERERERFLIFHPVSGVGCFFFFHFISFRFSFFFARLSKNCPEGRCGSWRHGR